MKKGKYLNSIVWQVVFFPVGTVLLILIISIFLCIYSIQVLSNREVENNRNALQISLNQLQSELNQIDEIFAEYLSVSNSYAYLSKITEKEPIDTFLEYQMETMNWMNSQISMHTNVKGAFVYYENLDMLLFRGNTNEKMHKYIKSQLKQEREYDHWELVTVGTEWYVINIKKYNDFYGGVWMPAAQIQEQLSVEEEALMGIMYMMDWRNENTAPTTLVQERLKTVGYQNIVNGKTTIQLEDTVYYNNIIKTEEGEIYFGILIPKNFFYFRIPTAVKGIVVLLIISIQLFYIRINIFVCS